MALSKKKKLVLTELASSLKKAGFEPNDTVDLCEYVSRREGLELTLAQGEFVYNILCPEN